MEGNSPPVNMTFTDFHSFAEWCDYVEEYTVVEYNKPEKKVIIGDLKDTNGMAVCELLLSAYDSGFHFGAMVHDQYDGCVVVYED